jgi:putative oxidoreductase
MNKLIAKVLLGTHKELINTSFLLLRCTIGIILFIVGSGKVLGWFGGFGFNTTSEFYGKMGFSVFLAYLSSYTEFIGGLLLTIGFLTRPAAIIVFINMLIATIVMLPNGFLGPRGASYPFAFLIITIIILLVGPMNYSLDYFLVRFIE